jgi:hypothetical protein
VRLIDAGVLYIAFEQEGEKRLKSRPFEEAKSILRDAIAENGFEITECENCKYASRGFGEKSHRCNLHGTMVFDGDFCSQGAVWSGEE